jgi:galactonate dehydratase
MRIVAVRTYVIPTGWRKPVMVEVEVDEGITGIGEAGVAYGYGGTAVAELIEEIARRAVIGRDAGQIEEIWNHVYDHAFWSKNGGAIHFAALSAIEHALWDIKGKALGVPVHALLGGALIERIPLYANGWWAGCMTATDFARAAEETVAQGYRALKLYPLGTPDPDTIIRHPTRRRLEREAAKAAVERVAAIRDAVGPDVEIYLDLGGGLTTDETIRIVRRFEEYDIGFVEEPADPAIPGAYRVLGQHLEVPIAAGERAYSRYGFHKLLDTWAVGIVQPDVCNTGGLMEARKIAAMAEVYNARLAPHNYGGPLATVLAAHLCAMAPNFMTLEFFPGYRDEGDVVEILEEALEDQAADGFVPLPTGPGLGVTLNRKAVASYLCGNVCLS